MKTSLILLCISLMSVTAGCRRDTGDGAAKPSTVDDTVRTMTQYDTLKAGKQAQEKLKGIGASQEKDRNEVGID